jgi:hypothetical protein
MLRSILFAVVSAILVVASPATANLLSNPGFDDDLSGWSNTQGKTWSSEDSNDNPGSGSVEIEVAEIGNDAVSICVPAAGNLTYGFGVDVKLTLSSNNQGRAGIVVHLRGEANCEGEDLTTFPGNASTPVAADWTNVDGTIDSPAGTASALIELKVTKTNGSGGSVIANLDDAVFDAGSGGPACGNPIAPFGAITASDALHVLRSSVGSASCDLCLCDVNGNGTTTASDALAVLRSAVGLGENLQCVACA